MGNSSAGLEAERAAWNDISQSVATILRGGVQPELQQTQIDLHRKLNDLHTTGKIGVNELVSDLIGASTWEHPKFSVQYKQFVSTLLHRRRCPLIGSIEHVYMNDLFRDHTMWWDRANKKPGFASNAIWSYMHPEDPPPQTDPQPTFKMQQLHNKLKELLGRDMDLPIVENLYQQICGATPSARVWDYQKNRESACRLFETSTLNAIRAMSNEDKIRQLLFGISIVLPNQADILMMADRILHVHQTYNSTAKLHIVDLIVLICHLASFLSGVPCTSICLPLLGGGAWIRAPLAKLPSSPPRRLPACAS
jgi:hypothetical protein